MNAEQFARKLAFYNRLIAVLWVLCTGLNLGFFILNTWEEDYVGGGINLLLLIWLGFFFFVRSRMRQIRHHASCPLRDAPPR